MRIDKHFCSPERTFIWHSAKPISDESLNLSYSLIRGAFCVNHAKVRIFIEIRKIIKENTSDTFFNFKDIESNSSMMEKNIHHGCFFLSFYCNFALSSNFV